MDCVQDLVEEVKRLQNLESNQLDLSFLSLY